MSHVPNLLKHNGILVHYTTYPEGSVERAKALGLNLWSTYRRVESTVGLWETECQIVAREEAWKPLGLKSQDEYIAAITGKLPSEVTEEIQARSRDKIRELKDAYPDWTYQKIAEHSGVSRQYVHKVLSTKDSQREELVAPPTIEGNSSKADFRKLPAELQQKVAAKEVSLNAAAIAAGIRKKPSHNDTALKAFRRSQDRVGLLRDILSAFITEGGQQALYEVQAAVEGLRRESPKEKATKGVRIDSGALEATDKFEQVPKDKWFFLMLAKRDFLARRVAYDCRCLVEFCEEAELVYADCGFSSAAEMIQHGYELDPVEIELAVAWLKHNQPKDNQPCD